MKQLTRIDLDQLSAKAAAAPRQRANFNVHDNLEAAVQRLAIAMEPGTYVRPHRHKRTFELLFALRGEFIALVFDEAGRVTERIPLGGNGAAVIEHGAAQWHAVVSLKPGSIVFEVKSGAYEPIGPADFAPWSPEEGTASARELVEWYRTAQVGESFS